MSDHSFLIEEVTFGSRTGAQEQEFTFGSVYELTKTNVLDTLPEGGYFVACRIVVECIARPLKFAHSRIINSQIILQGCKRQLKYS